MFLQKIDSIEDFFNEMKKARNIADTSVEAWQTEMKDGDHFIRVIDNLVIYGKIVPLEYEEDRYLYNQPHMKNIRWAMCYSYICEEGEPGGVHVNYMTFKLTPEQFEAAKNADWPNELEFIYYNIMNMSRGGDA
jgi:hypothetical protein